MLSASLNRTFPYFFVSQGKHLMILFFAGSCEQTRQRRPPRDKEGNALFNDALNTFYKRLYDIRHMVKDHSDSER